MIYLISKGCTEKCYLTQCDTLAGLYYTTDNRPYSGLLSSYQLFFRNLIQVTSFRDEAGQLAPPMDRVLDPGRWVRHPFERDLWRLEWPRRFFENSFSYYNFTKCESAPRNSVSCHMFSFTQLETSLF